MIKTPAKVCYNITYCNCYLPKYFVTKKPVKPLPSGGGYKGAFDSFRGILNIVEYAVAAYFHHIRIHSEMWRSKRVSRTLPFGHERLHLGIPLL